MIVLGALPRPLRIHRKRSLATVTRGVGQLRSCVPGPARHEGLRWQRAEHIQQGFLIGHGHKEIESGLRFDMVEQFRREVLTIHDHESPSRLRIEDARCQGQRVPGRVRGCLGRSPRGEANRLTGVDIEYEGHLGHFGRSRGFVFAAALHLPLAETAHTMGVDGQGSTAEVVGGAAELAQGHLEALDVGNGVFSEETVDRPIGCEKGETVSEFEAPLTQGATVAQARDGQGGLVDRLQRQAWLDRLGRPVGPTPEQVPDPEPE